MEKKVLIINEKGNEKMIEYLSEFLSKKAIIIINPTVTKNTLKKDFKYTFSIIKVTTNKIRKSMNKNDNKNEYRKDFFKEYLSFKRI